MLKYFAIILFAFTVLIPARAQDGLNQVVVVNGGQFGNPLEQCNIASFDPVSMNYIVFDTIPVNSVQDIIISGDTAYVAAQNFLVMYDLDTYQRIALDSFPGMSAHQLELHDNYLFATNYFGQTSDNLYVYDRRTLSLVDTIQEITHPGGTMVFQGGKLFISQNQKGNIDACPPWGCLNDTLGYLSVIDVASLEWEMNIGLNNNGNECGRLLNQNGNLISLNEVSGTVTAYAVDLEMSYTDTIPNTISTMRYRTEAEVIDGELVALFDGGIGVLSNDLMTVEAVVDTPVIAFAYDVVNDMFFATGTDFFSFTNGYAFTSEGMHLYDFPIGFGPEVIAVHYNNQPVGTAFEVESRDTILLNVNDFAVDPDGDNIVASRVENAPINGILTIQPGGSLQYVSLSPGSADAFRVEVCDDKLNPLCSFINVTVLPVTGITNTEWSNTTVFPNPATDRLYISGLPEGASVELFNSLGEQVRSYGVVSDIDISDLPNGSYFMRLSLGAAFRLLPIQKM